MLTPSGVITQRSPMGQSLLEEQSWTRPPPPPPHFASQLDIGVVPPPRVTQQTSPVGQLELPVHVSPMPAHCPCSAHEAPIIEMQHS
jgi:hypothetical protein